MLDCGWTKGRALLLTRVLALGCAALGVMALSGCDLKHAAPDLVAGKQLFIAKCGACHTLARASTSGTAGPNLDAAFRQDRRDGIDSASIAGLVDYWIAFPDRSGVMPAMIYRGQQAEDVAGYVGRAAAAPGADTGELAAAVQQNVPVTPAAGRSIFTGVGGCGSCHALAAAGTSGTAGPNLTERLADDCRTPASLRIRGATLDQCIETAIVNPYAFIPSGYRAGVMPSNLAKTLSHSQIRALVAFLASVTR